MNKNQANICYRDTFHFDFLSKQWIHHFNWNLRKTYGQPYVKWMSNFLRIVTAPEFCSRIEFLFDLFVPNTLWFNPIARSILIFCSLTILLATKGVKKKLIERRPRIQPYRNFQMKCFLFVVCFLYIIIFMLFLCVYLFVCYFLIQQSSCEK